jgi:hypothetical protein
MAEQIRLTVYDFHPGDPVWYTPIDSTARFQGVVDGYFEGGASLNITYRRWIHGYKGDTVALIPSIVGQFAINEGRLYHRDDGEDIQAALV